MPGHAITTTLDPHEVSAVRKLLEHEIECIDPLLDDPAERNAAVRLTERLMHADCHGWDTA